MQHLSEFYIHLLVLQGLLCIRLTEVPADQ